VNAYVKTCTFIALLDPWMSLIVRKTKNCYKPNQVTSLKDLSDSCFYEMFLMKNRMKNKIEMGHFNV